MDKLAEREAAVLSAIAGALRVAVIALPEVSELSPLIAAWADQCVAESESLTGRPVLQVL